MCFCVIVAEADVYKANNVGATPLYWASLNGHVDVVNVLLLAAEADVDKATDMGATPLILASENGHLEVVKALLAAKAEESSRIR